MGLFGLDYFLFHVGEIFIYNLFKNFLIPFSFYSSSAAAAAAKVLQSCLTLCDPIDSSPPGSPVNGILQARVLEWIAIALPASSSGTPII